MSTLLELSQLGDGLAPEILPAEVRLSVSGKVSALLSALEPTSAIVPSKEVIPLTTNLSITASDSFGDTVTLHATDGFRAVRALVDSDIKVHASGSALIPAKRLRDVAKLSPEQYFRLDVLSDHATFRSGRAMWRIQLPAGKELPDQAETSNIVMKEYPAPDFLSALSRTLPARAAFTGRMSLSQLNLTEGVIRGCDGSRVHSVTLPVKGLSTTIPALFAESLMSLLGSFGGEKFLLGASENTVAAQVGRTLITGQKLTLPYPSLYHLTLEPSMVNTDELTVSRSELVSAIKRVRVSADPDLALVTLILRKVKGSWTFLVQATDKAGNASQEAVEASYGGSTAREESFNYKHLTEFLGASKEDSVTLQFGKSTSAKKAPLYLKSEDFEGVIQPMLSHLV